MTLNIFLILLVLFKCVNSAPTNQRYAHATVVVNNILYVMGGFTNGRSSREFFSLDLSQTFDVITPQWKDLSETSPLPVLATWGTASANTNNDTIFLFGGVMFDAVTGTKLKSVVYTYDFKSNQWLVNPPAFQGIAPAGRREFASISDPLTGKLYIHGGGSVADLTNIIVFKDFFTLDGNKLSWNQIGTTGINMPSARFDHVTVLIADEIIVFIGGMESITGTLKDSVSIPMERLTLYDTKANTWDVMTIVGGPKIDSRIGHSGVYANGRIIIYGGTTPGLDVTPNPELIVLDTTVKPFKWVVPPVTTPEVAINSLTFHKANLIGDYMIVTFGNITNKLGSPTETSDSIQILDITNYKWVKSFPGLSPSTTTSTIVTPTLLPDSDTGSTTILAIVIPVCLILIIVVSIGIFLSYRRNKQKNVQGSLLSSSDVSSSDRSTQMMFTSQDQFNNNDNLMRNISTTPSLMSSSNNQGFSNHNSIYNPSSPTLPMFTTLPSTTLTTTTNSIYGDVNNNNYDNIGVIPQIYDTANLIQQQQQLQLQLLQQQSMLGNYASDPFPPTSNLQSGLDLNNPEIDQTHSHMSTTNHEVYNDNDDMFYNQ